jgi:hypothetical protein
MMKRREAAGTIDHPSTRRDHAAQLPPRLPPRPVARAAHALARSVEHGTLRHDPGSERVHLHGQHPRLVTDPEAPCLKVPCLVFCGEFDELPVACSARIHRCPSRFAPQGLRRLLHMRSTRTRTGTSRSFGASSRVEGVKRTLALFHRYAPRSSSAACVALMGLTGASLVFKDEIEARTHPERALDGARAPPSRMKAVLRTTLATVPNANGLHHPRDGGNAFRVVVDAAPPAALRRPTRRRLSGTVRTDYGSSGSSACTRTCWERRGGIGRTGSSAWRSWPRPGLPMISPVAGSWPALSPSSGHACCWHSACDPRCRERVTGGRRQGGSIRKPRDVRTAMRSLRPTRHPAQALRASWWCGRGDDLSACMRRHLLAAGAWAASRFDAAATRRVFGRRAPAIFAQRGAATLRLASAAATRVSCSGWWLHRLIPLC